MRSGDTVIVWKLDRLGCSLKDLIETLNLLNNRGINFISQTESIDTTTPGGKLIFHLIGALAEFERDLIRERTVAGLAAARARGRVSGRPKRASKGKVALARHLFKTLPIRWLRSALCLASLAQPSSAMSKGQRRRQIGPDSYAEIAHKILGFTEEPDAM